MNTYLKIDAELPAGLDYLNLNSISIPVSVQQIGNLISAFNFTGGMAKDLVNQSSKIIGEVNQTNGGVLLGQKSYINTNLDELPEFTSIAVIKPLTLTNDIVISTFTHETFSQNGKAFGVGTAPNRIHARQENGNFGLLSLNPAPVRDSFMIVALSRDKTNLVGCSRVLGKSGITKGTCTNEIQKMTPFGIGYTSNAKISSSDYHSIFSYAAIHNKALNEEELINYVNNLASELSGYDI